MASSLLKLVNDNNKFNYGTFCAWDLRSMATLIYNMLTLRITAGYTYYVNLCTECDFLRFSFSVQKLGAGMGLRQTTGSVIMC